MGVEGRAPQSMPPSPHALLFFAIFSGSDAVLDAALDELSQAYGSLLIRSERFDFVESDYYERSMGGGLRKQLVAVDRLIAQDELARIKIETGQLEASLHHRHPLGVARSVNIDPGMIDAGKVMLASTKNRAHRIYQGLGIFVEVTLYLRHDQWVSWPWTYPDYQRADVHEFMSAARAAYRTMTSGAR